MHVYTSRQIWGIAFPLLVSMLMEQLIGMTDAAFLGHVGNVELGASALGGIFYVVIFMLAVGFSTGVQILMGRRYGEGNHDRIGSIFYHSIGFLLVLAAALFALSQWLAPAFFGLIIESPDVCAATTTYFLWRVPGFFFAFVTIMFRAFFVATTHTRTLTLNSLVMVASNVLFNYALIFGHFGLPALGIAGAALGSTLAEGVSFVFFVVHTFRHVPLGKFGLNRVPRFRLSLLGQILRVSGWTMLQNMLSLLTWFIFFISIEHEGESALAATNIIRNISAFTFLTLMSLCSTASTLTSNLMGQNEKDAIWPMLRRIYTMAVTVLVPLIAVIALFPGGVMRIFTDDLSLIATARPALYVLLSSYVFTIPGQLFLSAVSGTGNTRIALRIECVALLLYTVYVVGAIFCMRVSLPLCWASEYVYNAGIALMGFAYMKWGNWRTKQI